jgi:hypothetical protein
LAGRWAGESTVVGCFCAARMKFAANIFVCHKATKPCDC